MVPFPAITPSSDFVAVGAASVQFATLTTMAANQMFAFASSTACWIKQGANPTASAAAGSMFVPVGVQVLISGTDGAKLAVIQDAAGGKASLTPVRS